MGWHEEMKKTLDLLDDLEFLRKSIKRLEETRDDVEDSIRKALLLWGDEGGNPGD